MLIKCPDCKKSISSDCDRCVRCGCIIDSSTMIFEPAAKWSGLGIVSFVMVLGYIYLLFIIAAICSGISAAMALSSSSSITPFVVMYIILLVYPIAQIVFASIPLRSGEPYRKWPSIVGIIGGCTGIIIDIVILITFVWTVYLG